MKLWDIEKDCAKIFADTPKTFESIHFNYINPLVFLESVFATGHNPNQCLYSALWTDKVVFWFGFWLGIQPCMTFEANLTGPFRESFLYRNARLLV